MEDLWSVFLLSLFVLCQDYFHYTTFKIRNEGIFLGGDVSDHLAMSYQFTSLLHLLVIKNAQNLLFTGLLVRSLVSCQTTVKTIRFFLKEGQNITSILFFKICVKFQTEMISRWYLPGKKVRG